ncbi:hypothetical protein HHX47_DHR1001833 [Lentinula edodes]|nr:hypothetical protein HHX47_DHR1001833 [Lentinula edodes]
MAFYSPSSSLGGYNNQKSPERAPPIDLTLLHNASTVLEEQFAKDSQAIPELGEILPNGQASSSYSVFPDDIRVPFQKRKLVGIPEALFQYYSSTSVNSHMGLIPEIERVWISIDHKLFLWDYNDSQEISSFVDQPYVITHVGLVKPKKGLFIEEISHLLVILPGTSTQFRKEVKLYATDLTISTEVEMTSVAGTVDGRIFMYRIVSVIADSERECLYTLTEKNVISLFKPTSEKSVQHIQTLSNLYKAAQDRCPGSPAITPQTFQIVSLHPISLLESRSGVQLLAITTNGVRLYFSPGLSYGGSMQTLGMRTLQLSHVRLPPSNLIHPDEQENPHRPAPAIPFGAVQGQPPRQSRPYIVSAIDSSCYVDGLTVAAQPGDVDTVDYLLCLSPDLTRIGSLDQLNLPQPPPQPTYSMYSSQNVSSRPPMTEYATLLSIPGRTWAMAPVPQTPIAADVAGINVLNELGTQVSEHPRQFMILTNVGVTFLVKRRSLDYLKAVIEELQSEGNVQPIIEFRDSFGRNQTCAMLLALASGNIFLDGSDPASNTISLGNADLAAVAKQAFYDFGEKPIWSERTVYGKSEHQGTAIFSGRREGLALYFSRLVKPIWKIKLVVAGPTNLQLAVQEARLITIQKNLYALKDLLDKNPHLFHSSPGDSAASRAPAMEQEAWKAEQASIAQLLSLLTRTIEALSFVLLLNDYHFADIMTKCDVEIQKLVSSLTFEDLITTQNGLAIRPPFLETHLKREPLSAEKYQLLWQFYVKDGQPLRAAEVLLALAESTEFQLQLDNRLEYLTLAVGNAKSHPVSAGGRHETAIAFLTDLEEKLEVAQVQLEMYSTLLPHVNDASEVGVKINALASRLYTMSELYQDYAIPFDLPILKLICVHVAEHRDEVMLRQVWNQIFDQVVEEESDPIAQADQLSATLEKLGRRFYPSVFAFPLQLVTDLLIRFSLDRKEVLQSGWAPRVLARAGIPYVEIWDALHDMYESHIPPFNAQANVQAISSDIATLFTDWVEEVKRPTSSISRGEFPVSRIDFAIDQYMAELHADRIETKSKYEAVKRQLRREW